MSPWWFTAALAPVVYFVAASRQTGFRAQPELARARTADGFQRVADAAGGRGAITTGVVVDLGFIVLFAAVAALLLARSDGPWWLALVPAALDVAQDLLIVLASGGSPSSGELLALLVLTLAMYAAYAAAVVALGVALVRSF